MRFCTYRLNMSHWQKMVADTMPVHTLSPVNFEKSNNTRINRYLAKQTKKETDNGKAQN